MGKRLATAAALAFLAIAPGFLQGEQEIPAPKENISQVRIDEKLEERIHELLKESNVTLKQYSSSDMKKTELGINKEMTDVGAMNATMSVNEFGKISRVAANMTGKKMDVGMAYDATNRRYDVQGSIKSEKTTLSWNIQDFKNATMNLSSRINKNFTALTNYDIQNQRLGLGINASFKNLNMTAARETDKAMKRIFLNANYMIPKVVGSVNLTYTGINGISSLSFGVSKRFRYAGIECGAQTSGTQALSRNITPYIRISYSYRF
jgi:hypothetical protein